MKQQWRGLSCKTWVLMAALMAILASASRAEQSVGLEAEGVDPSAALHNTLGLDVRDALGRPVSKEVIERQLARSGLQAAESNTVFSGLPKLKALLKLLVLAVPLRAWFGTAQASGGSRSSWALAPARRAEKAAALPLLAVAALASADGGSTSRTFSAIHGRCPAPTVLRC